MNTYRRLCLILLACSLAPQARADDDFFLKDGDRVVFYGDSITDQRLYTTYTESYVVTRFPRWKVEFVHSGWGGDRVGGGGGGPIDVRLKRDVIAYRPTVVTVMLGMNDASYRPFDQGIFDTYAKGYAYLVTTIKDARPGVRMTLIAPSPFDDVTRSPMFEGGYNAVLVRYGEFVKDLARKEGVGFADLNAPVVEATKKANQLDAQNSTKLNPDRVHPGPAGQLLMTAALLKAWSAPAVVSVVEINADGAKLVRAENTKVADLAARDGFAWTQEDAALPMPINLKDPVVTLALRASDVLTSLDREILKVVGAPASEYQLKIDGKEVGTVTREALEAGVNLAERETPMLEQGRRVHELTLQHNNLHFTRWRNVEVPLQGQDPENLRRALDALDTLETDLVTQQRAAAQPKAHRFELVPRG